MLGWPPGDQLKMTRDKVLESAREYFRAQMKPQSFVAGESYIPPSGKVLTEDDLHALMDATLDLWLTAGRFSKIFEAELPAWFGRKGFLGESCGHFFFVGSHDGNHGQAPSEAGR